MVRLENIKSVDQQIIQEQRNLESLQRKFEKFTDPNYSRQLERTRDEQEAECERLAKENAQMMVEYRKIERLLDKRVKESQNKDPNEENEDKIDLEIRNLKFKIKYLEGKIATEEMSLAKLENQKYLVQQRVGQQF